MMPKCYTRELRQAGRDGVIDPAAGEGGLVAWILRRVFQSKFLNNSSRRRSARHRCNHRHLNAHLTDVLIVSKGLIHSNRGIFAAASARRVARIHPYIVDKL
jgi:hypothetical protein